MRYNNSTTKHPPPAGGTLFTKEGKDIKIKPEVIL